MYLSCSTFQATCINFTLHFYVHTRETSSDPWDLAWHGTKTDAWQSFALVSSGDIGIPLQDGQQVALSVGWQSENISYYYETATTNTFTIGSFYNGVQNGNLINTSNPSIGVTANSYYQQINTTKIE